jgi:molybdopterin-guanine dinucleotide biosynthesis protein
MESCEAQRHKVNNLTQKQLKGLVSAGDRLAEILSVELCSYFPGSHGSQRIVKAISVWNHHKSAAFSPNKPRKDSENTRLAGDSETVAKKAQ